MNYLDIVDPSLKMLIFSGTNERAKRLDVTCMHGGLTREERQIVFDSWEVGNIRALVVTTPEALLQHAYSVGLESTGLKADVLVLECPYASAVRFSGAMFFLRPEGILVDLHGNFRKFGASIPGACCLMEPFRR